MTNKQLERKARFIIVVKELNIDRQLLAKELGYKKRYIDQVLSADKNFSDTMFLKFTKWCTAVNEKWLDDGIGEMLNTLNTEEKTVLNDPYVAYQKVAKKKKEDPLVLLREQLESYETRISDLEKEVERMREILKNQDGKDMGEG